MNKIMQVRAGFHGQRNTEIETGKEYIVQPLNPRKLKNRGRHCLVLDFVPVSEAHPNDIVAKVRYIDNNRIGKVNLSDLIPA
jgi:hypothetical protein